MQKQQAGVLFQRTTCHYCSLFTVHCLLFSSNFGEHAVLAALIRRAHRRLTCGCGWCRCRSCVAVLLPELEVDVRVLHVHSRRNLYVAFDDRIADPHCTRVENPSRILCT